jgi:hypothetical protein
MGIEHLLDRCPQSVLGRYVVIASFDSGALIPNEKERVLGWCSSDSLTYTSKVASVETLPYDNFDEWYVFTSPLRLTDCEVFVNSGGFTLEIPASAPTWDPTWDRAAARDAAERLTALQARFWNQLERLGAESYIAQGDCFVFVSANPDLFDSAVAVFESYV